MIDLHVHSHASDGSLSPSQVTSLAVECGLHAFALTDHDTVRGISEATKKAMDYNQRHIRIEVIPGVEISAAFRKSDIHILGLYLDDQNPDLLHALRASEKEREERNRKMAANLSKAGISISVEALQKENGNAVLTRAHFAKYMAGHGYVKTAKEAFQTYLDSTGPYYVGREYITPEAAITLIRNAGGIPVLAHPLLYHLSEPEINALVHRLKQAGLEGIEAIYSSNRNHDEAFVRSLARKYDLAITGGSDFHGDLKPDIQIGKGRGNLRIPDELLLGIKERLQQKR